MKGRWTLAELIAVAALLLAAWAVYESRYSKFRRGVLDGLENAVACEMDLHAERISWLESRAAKVEERVNEIANALDPIHERINKVEDALPVGAAWPGVIRTTSGEHPQVRHIESDEAGR